MDAFERLKKIDTSKGDAAVEKYKAAQPDVSSSAPSTPKAAGTSTVPAVSVSGEAWTRATPSQTKVPSVNPSPVERVIKTVTGGLKKSAGATTDLLRTLYESHNDSEERSMSVEAQKNYADQAARFQTEYEQMLADNQKQPGTWSQQMLENYRQRAEMAQDAADKLFRVNNQNVKQGTAREVAGIADRITESGAQDIQRAKQGAGFLGELLVDAGASTVQVGADLAANALMGTTGMIPFALRAAGGGTQKARQDGADLHGQLAYGGLTAAKEIVTEKMFNIAAPYAKAYGKGFTGLEDSIESSIRKAVDKFAKTETGARVLGGVLTGGASMLTEGLEELIGDWMEWQMPRVYGGDVASAQETLSESLYDFLVGSVSGGFGAVMDGGTWNYDTTSVRNRNENAEADRKAADYYDTLKNGIFAQPAEYVRAATARQDSILPRATDENGNWFDTQGNKHYPGVTEQRQADFRQAEQIARNFGADFRVGELDNGAAGEYKNGTITISPTAQNPVREVLIHEMTHHMETSGLYGDFRTKILGFMEEDMGVSVNAMEQSIIREYKQYNVELDIEGASRELVAKFAEEKLFQDEQSIQRLLQTDRNLFQRIYDWIRDTIDKVRGTSEERFLIDAQRLYEKALRQAGTQQGTGAAQNTFAGVNARTANLSALSTAQELESSGADAEVIRRQTGWYRGMDGKWRFEIDDSGMRYQQSGTGAGNVTLGDMIQHDALFEAYPELKDVKVRFENLEMGKNGYFDPKSNTVVLNTFLWNQPEDVIVHEVQHAIQQAEGFTQGASPEYWRGNQNPNRKYRNTAGEIEARDAAARRQMTPAQRELKMPAMGDENTVFAEQAGVMRDYIPGVIGEDAVRHGIQEVAGMEPVTAVQGTEFAKGDVDLVTQVTNYFDSLGNMVFNPQLGDVKLSRSGAKSDIAHGIGRKKAAAFAAVPSVLENGRVIDYQTNWKGRGYDTAVVAAPITIQGENYLAGVILTRSQKENSFYLHEVLLTEKGTTPFKTGGRKSGNPGGDVPSVLSLLRQVQDVKENRSTETGQYSMGSSFSELVQEQRGGGQYSIRGTAQGTPAQTGKQNALDILGVHPEGDMGNYEGVEFVRGADKGKKDTKRATRQAEARLRPTKGEKKFARGIADGDYTVEDIPASMNRATVTELADYYTAENSYKGMDGVQERGRQIREETERMAAELFQDQDRFKPISMLKMNERTPERVMRSIFGDQQGELINDNYIYPVQANEAEKTRFIQRQLDEVRTFEDSQGRRSALTKEERAIVQQMMEDRFVGETIASMEIGESIKNAAENIRRGKDPLDAAREFSLNAEERGLAQQLARWMQNQEWLESGELDSVKINNAVQKYAEQYDLFYDAVNDFLTAHGYGTIGFIKGYAPHMQGVDTQNKLLSALQSMGVTTDASNLPTSISGLTADYKPGKRWVPFFQSRMGNKTDYDVAKGYESYVSYLGDIFYHTDDIARLRGVSRYLRKTYGPEEINSAIDHAESLRYADLNTQTEVLKDAGKISEGTRLSYEDARAMMDEYIDGLYKNVTKVMKYGEFVKYIDNYANLLAGKQSMADRGMEYMAGRTSLNAGNKLVAAFGRAQVAGNVSSVLNQSSQLAQIAAEVDGKYVAKAVADLTKKTGGKLWTIKETKLFDQSDLLTGKKGIEYLTADDSKFDRMVSAMFKPADIMDSMVSALAVQSKYNQLMAEGNPPELAMLEANRWATQIMASRMKGSRPMAFESKNVVTQMLHMFQVEAMNSMEHLTKDLPLKYKQIGKQYGRKAEARAVATVLTKGLVSAFLLNRAAEAIYGGTPAMFDVLGYVANFVSSGLGMTTNEALKQLLNAGWKAMFGEPLFEDDDEDKEKKDFDWGTAVKDTAYNVSNDIPFWRNAAGLLGLGDQTMPFANMAEEFKGVGKAVSAEDRSAGEIGASLLELGSTLLPGGRQMQKTAQGVTTMLQGGRTYGYGDKQRLQYPVEQKPDKWLQAVLFGNSGLSETREFYASGESGLSAKQTRTVNDMASAGADRQEVYDTIQKIRKGEQTEDKLTAITESALTDDQKLQVFREVVADDESKWPEKLESLMKAGMSWDQTEQAYQEYLKLYRDETISAGEKATQLAVWADRSDLKEWQKTMVKNTFVFYSQMKADASRYESFSEAGLNTDTALRLTEAVGALEPEDGKQQVSDVQRYRTIVNTVSYERGQTQALEAVMDEDAFAKFKTVYQQGISPEDYVTFLEKTSGLEADKDSSGKTVSGSKKQKVMDAINRMDLSKAQKTALYYAAGYKESTLDEAPWYYDLDMPRLK